jgi:hypothetical protein
MVVLARDYHDHRESNHHYHVIIREQRVVVRYPLPGDRQDPSLRRVLEIVAQ